MFCACKPLPLLILLLAALAAVGAPPALAQGREPVSFEVQGTRPLEVPAGGEATLAVSVRIEPAWHVYGDNEEGLIPLSFEVEKGAPVPVTVARAELPKAVVKTLAGVTAPVLEGAFEAKVVLAAPADAAPGTKAKVTLVARYQACDDKSCLLPAESKLPIEVAIGPRAPSGGGQTGPTPPTPTPPAPPASRELAAPAAPVPQALIWEALGALLGGILVTLTPCVYPLIPVTIGYFQRQAGKSRPAVLLLALAYGLGIMVTYTVVGVASALLGAELGAVLGNVYVGWGFVLLFVVLAASMFGAFELRLPSSLTTKIQGKERKGLSGALFLGLTQGLVAAPCVGPLAAGLMLIVAQSQDVVFGATTFSAFGLGLALPFMALGAATGAASSLPRAGEWMEHVKTFFGYILLAFAVYFVNVVVGSQTVVFVLLGLLLTTAAMALARSEAAPLRALSLLFALSGIWFALGPFALAEDGPIKPPQKVFEPKIAWREDHDAAVAEARRAGKGVMVDFTARWCIPCQQMELSTWRDEAVVRELKQRFIAVKVDITNEEASQKLHSETYKSFAVPFIAFYDSKGNYLADKAISGKTTTEELLARLRSVP